MAELRVPIAPLANENTMRRVPQTRRMSTVRSWVCTKEAPMRSSPMMNEMSPVKLAACMRAGP